MPLSYKGLLDITPEKIFQEKIGHFEWKYRIKRNFITFQSLNDLEDQGVKIHISVDSKKLDKAFDVLLPILSQSDIVSGFKVVHKDYVEHDMKDAPPLIKQALDRIYQGAQFTAYLRIDPNDKTDASFLKFNTLNTAIQNALDKAEITSGKVPNSDVIFSKSISGRYDPSEGNIGQYKPAVGIKDMLTSLEKPFFKNAFLKTMGEEFAPLVEKMLSLSQVKRSLKGGEDDKITALYHVIIAASRKETIQEKIDYLTEQKSNPVLHKTRNIPLPNFFRPKTTLDAINDSIKKLAAKKSSLKLDKK